MKIPTHYNDLFVDLYHYQGGDEDAVKARLRLGDTIVATVGDRLVRISMKPNFDNLEFLELFYNRCCRTPFVVESKPGIRNPFTKDIIIKSENQLIFK